MNRRKVGKEMEEKAVRYLKEQGYKILAQNYWTRFAELDIIATDGVYLCFIEIKYRKNSKYEAPAGVITIQKMKRMGKAAQFYLKEKRILPDTPMRFDVLFILGEEITWVKNAFDYVQ